MILPCFNKQTLSPLLILILSSPSAESKWQWTELQLFDGSAPISDSGSSRPAVALAGDGNILFGRPDFRNLFEMNGIMDVYTGQGSYSFTQNMSPALGSDVFNFGATVAVHYDAASTDETIALVGASNATSSNGLAGAGMVWVYSRNAQSNRRYIYREMFDGLVPVSDAGFGHAIAYVHKVSNAFIFAIGAPNGVGDDFARTGTAYLTSYAGDALLVMSGGAIAGAADGDKLGYAVAGDWAESGAGFFGGIVEYALIGAPGGDYARVFTINKEVVPPTWEQIQVGLMQGSGNEQCGQSVSMGGEFAAVGCPGSNTIRVYDVLLGVQVGEDITGTGYGMDNRVKLVGRCGDTSQFAADCVLFAGASDGTIGVYRLSSDGLSWEKSEFLEEENLKLDVTDGVYTMDADNVQVGQVLLNRLVTGQQDALRAFTLNEVRTTAPSATSSPTTPITMKPTRPPPGAPPTSGAPSAQYDLSTKVIIGFLLVGSGAIAFV